MRRTLVMMVVAWATASVAQVVEVKVDIAVPTIVFAAPPPLVVVQPGVQVVEDSDDEVFFVDGFYWCRRDGRWFRTKSHQGGWVVMPANGVPVALVALPPGQYKKWKRANAGPGPGKGHGHGKHKDK